MKIYVYLSLDEKQFSQLRKYTGEDIIIPGNPSAPKEEEKEKALQADVIFGGVPADWVRDSQNLKWIQLSSTGIDFLKSLDWDELGKKVLSTNLAGFLPTL